ncbi:hypothetical protein [Nitrosomonas mobilis]|uniref:Transmembrane protein n=1 Tax=Nitrosomonas mobilis TaxID=51642 RepID=A0A1G5SHP8_9PROT|nr:hypothetical protein [Nitrosomonas mobilis]SCZ86733.1 exported hypothetical protein [Nitrosomonas mobilis]
MRLSKKLSIVYLAIAGIFLPFSSEAASVSKMKILTAPQSVEVGECSNVVNLQAQDRSGIATNVDFDTEIYFDQGSYDLEIYTDSNCSTEVLTLQMLAGTNNISFFFKGNSQGSKTLYVSTMNYQDSSQVEQILAAGSVLPPSPSLSPCPVPIAAPTPQYGRAVPAPIYGVTFDNVSNFPAKVTALQKLPHMPTVRIVLDPETIPADYSTPINAMKKSAYIMAELQDSADMKLQTINSFKSRAQIFFNGLKDSVDIWEVGNEINGDWLGTNVKNKLRAGFKVLDDAGATTAITFFYFGEPERKNNCIPAAQYEMFTWIKSLQQLDLPVAQRDPQNEKMRLNVDYIFVSWYPQQCNNIKPDWATVFAKLATIYPNAKIGFGEIGTANPQYGSSYELNLIQEFYPLASRVQMPSSYIGGYFWWYFAQEMNNSSIVNALYNAIWMGPQP